MRPVPGWPQLISTAGLALGLAALAVPARAEWVPVPAIPATPLRSLFVHGDTLATGADTTVHVSTDGGTTWQHSRRPVAGAVGITAVSVRNGRLYAGTFGQGVFISDDLGQTWQAFNQGLVGGFLDTQLFVVDLVARGDTLYAATAGAGVYLRRLAPPGTWQPSGTVFGPEQAENVNSLALGGGRLLASAGGNGMVFDNDPGQAEWTVSNLDNLGIHAGLQAFTATFTGTGWIVGTNLGVFRSVAGQEPWTPVGLGLGPLRWVAFAPRGGRTFAAFVTPLVAVFGESTDDGASWQAPDVLPGVFVQALGISRNTLFAARGDGLWRRVEPALSTPPPAGSGALRFALAGPDPFRDRATFRFELTAPGVASIALFDVMGRRTGAGLSGAWPTGPQVVTLDARDLAPGVYVARIDAGNAHGELRLVHVR